MGTPSKVISHGELIGRAGWRFVQVSRHLPVVPVGTLITERPPDGSVRARLRIRLL